MGSKSQVFLGLPSEANEASPAKVAVIQAPLENTTHYEHGTALGSQAILAASAHIEPFDLESGIDFSKVGITTFDPPALFGLNNEKALEIIERDVARALNHNQWPLCIGGEHTISLAAFRALQAQRGKFSVLQIDARADLRDTFEGSSLSHACVMRRAWDLGLSTVGVGIRSLSSEELEFTQQKQARLFTAQEIWRQGLDFAKISSALGPKVYVTIDISGFDPSECPGTGHPEPGGLSWWQGIDLLKHVFKHHEVIGADIVEVRPLSGDTRTEYFAARLAYQMIGYKFFATF